MYIHMYVPLERSLNRIFKRTFFVECLVSHYKSHNNAYYDKVVNKIFYMYVPSKSSLYRVYMYLGRRSKKVPMPLFLINNHTSNSY
jgi:hypothetical protein